MARTSTYTKDMLTKTIDYIENYENYDDEIPTMIGLSYRLQVSKKTIYNWSKVSENHELLHALGMLKNNQHRVLLNKGLKSEFNTAICKLMLMNNHGYSDKKETKNDYSHRLDQLKNTKNYEVLTNEELELIIREGRNNG